MEARRNESAMTELSEALLDTKACLSVHRAPAYMLAALEAAINVVNAVENTAIEYNTGCMDVGYSIEGLQHE